jgi:hypothetical protein
MECLYHNVKSCAALLSSIRVHSRAGALAATGEKAFSVQRSKAVKIR